MSEALSIVILQWVTPRFARLTHPTLAGNTQIASGCNNYAVERSSLQWQREAGDVFINVYLASFDPAIAQQSYRYATLETSEAIIDRPSNLQKRSSLDAGLHCPLKCKKIAIQTDEEAASLQSGNDNSGGHRKGKENSIGIIHFPLT